MKKAKPLFMWAGGKTKMLRHYMPIDRPEYSTYVEPFFGGGAMFLSEHPENSVINDINSEIMGIYSAVKKDSDAFVAECDEIVKEYFSTPDRKGFYYDLRSQYWKQPSTPSLYILMRLGFNGIWQTCKDSKGMFGTPAGLLNQTRREQILDDDNISIWSDRLSKSELLSVDYRDVFVPQNSFVFLDPPYRDSFTTYGTGFNDQDQENVIAKALEWANHSTVWISNRSLDGDEFFESRLPGGKFYYFDVTYTAGRRKRVGSGHEAKKAREFLCVLDRRN